MLASRQSSLTASPRRSLALAQQLPRRCRLQPLPVARPTLELPPQHGSFATESWAEEVCEIKPQAGEGKKVALKCAQALDELSEVQHQMAVDKRARDAAEAARKQNPGRCISASDDECDTL